MALRTDLSTEVEGQSRPLSDLNLNHDRSSPNASFRDAVDDYIKNGASMKRMNSGIKSFGQRTSTNSSKDVPRLETSTSQPNLRPNKPGFGTDLEDDETCKIYASSSEKSDKDSTDSARFPRRRKTVTFEDLPELCAYEPIEVEYGPNDNAENDDDHDDSDEYSRRPLPPVPAVVQSYKNSSLEESNGKRSPTKPFISREHVRSLVQARMGPKPEPESNEPATSIVEPEAKDEQPAPEPTEAVPQEEETEETLSTQPDTPTTESSRYTDSVPSSAHTSPMAEHHRKAQRQNLDAVLSAKESPLDNSIDSSVSKTPERVQKSEEQAMESPTQMGSFAKAFDQMFENQRRGYSMKESPKVIRASSSTHSSDSHRRVGSASSLEPWPSPTKPRHVPGNTSPLKHNSGTDYQQDEQGEEASPTRLDKALPSAPVSPTRGTRNFSKPIKPPTMSHEAKLFVRILSLRSCSGPLRAGMPIACVLDNGKHHVKTPWVTLRTTDTKFDQEFELLATSDLSFSLTLQTKYVASQLKPQDRSMKTFSRLLSSPKKHKVEDQYEALHGVVGNDGSFGKSRLTLKQILPQARLKSFTDTVDFVNEWATEPVMSKGKQISVKRLPPYEIARLRVQFFYLPPISAFAGRVPQSLTEATNDLNGFEGIKSWHQTVFMEGFLSQQGGDCTTWRRRFFSIRGAQMTSYHEATRAKRATIDLNKAVALIYDGQETNNGTLTSPTHSRTVSADGDDSDEGMMFVKDAFRIKFETGEIIEFYASSSESRNEWIKALAKIVGSVPRMAPWTQALGVRS